jgi:hypothetical protein
MEMKSLQVTAGLMQMKACHFHRQYYPLSLARADKAPMTLGVIDFIISIPPYIFVLPHIIVSC